MNVESKTLAPGMNFRELLAFGGVGVIATLIHVTVFSLVLESTSASPLQANMLAFVLAFLFSFAGHYRVTFTTATRQNPDVRGALLRFLVVALLGLTLNSGVVYVTTSILALHYFYAVALMVTMVPACIYLLSKYWAFRHTA